MNDDLSLDPKAFELRTRIFTRRQEEDNGILISKTKLSNIAFTDVEQVSLTVTKEVQNHRHEISGIIKANIHSSLITDRVNQQLKLEKEMGKMNRDHQHFVENLHHKLDSISDLEKNIMNMRSWLKKSNEGETTHSVVDKEISQSHEVTSLSDILVRCDMCERVMLKRLLPSHAEICRREGWNSAVGSGIAGNPILQASDGSNVVKPALLDSLDPVKICPCCENRILVQYFSSHYQCCNRVFRRQTATSSAWTPPGHPERLKSSAVTCCGMTLSWDLPIVDGGCQIFDFEISVSLVKLIPDKLFPKLTSRELIELPLIRTSRWCCLSPVTCDFFILTNLSANNEYDGIRVRCLNAYGPSQWCYLESPVCTLAAEPPSPPLHFRLDRISKSSLTLYWQVPHHERGAPIIEYEISIIGMFRTDESKEGNGNENLEEKTMIFHTRCPRTRFKARGFPGDTILKLIAVSAVNSAGKSVSTSLGVTLRILPPGRRQLILDEIRRCLKIKTIMIDTDFFQGFHQRIRKDNVMKKLFELLDGLADTDVKAEYDDDDATQDKIEDEWNKNEEDKKRSAKEEKESNMKQKIAIELSEMELSKNDHVEKLSTFQKRIDQINGEIERLKPYKGEFVNSSVLHDSLQRFETPLLRKELSEELEKNTTLLFQSKVFLIDQSKRKTVLLASRERIDDMILDRTAALQLFESRVVVLKRVKNIMHRPPKQLLGISLSFWKEFVEERKSIKLRAIKSFQKMIFRWYNTVFDVLRCGGRVCEPDTRILLDETKANMIATSDRDESKKNGGIGQVELAKVEKNRASLYSEVEVLIEEIVHAKQATKLLLYNKDQHKSLTENCNFTASELGVSQPRIGEFGEYVGCFSAHDALVHQRKQYHLDRLKSTRNKDGSSSQMNISQEDEVVDRPEMIFMRVADMWCFEGEYSKSLSLYEGQIAIIRSIEPINIKQLSIIHGRLGKLYLLMEKWDRALLEFDRQKSLANELSDLVELAHALFGMAKGYIGRFEYSDALQYLQVALTRCSALNDIMLQAECMDSISFCYDCMSMMDQARDFRERAEQLRNETMIKISSAVHGLEELEERLICSPVELAKVTNLERLSPLLVRLKHDRQVMMAQIEAFGASAQKLSRAAKELKGSVEDCEREAQRAATCTDDTIESSVFGGCAQDFEIEEFKVRLKVCQDSQIALLKDKMTEVLDEYTKVKNSQADLLEVEKEMAVEESPLVSSCHKLIPLRCLAFNTINVSGGDVLGRASSGVDMIAAAEGNNVILYELSTGTELCVFSGDGRGKGTIEPEGHLSRVTCLFFQGDRIYSGSVDATVQVWDIDERKRAMILEGHESTVTCVFADDMHIISGSSDTTIRVWDKFTAVAVRIVTGNLRSVSCLQKGLTWMISGGADGNIRIWNVSHQPRLKISLDKTLVGHKTGVSAIAYGIAEVISGDDNGDIFIWWKETGVIMYKCQAHSSQIRSIQFNATCIVSGSLDGSVRVTDVVSGKSIETLLGHKNAVCGVCFDSSFIMSASIDNSIRMYKWGKIAPAPSRYHMVTGHDSLSSLSKKYKVAEDVLMDWNCLKQGETLYSGQKLLVGKEIVTEGVQKVKIDSEMVYREKIRRPKPVLLYPRITEKARFETVQKSESGAMSNRMFSLLKKQTDLFSNVLNPERMSLGQRLVENGLVPYNPISMSQIYFFDEDNRREWLPVLESLVQQIILMEVEYVCHEVVINVRSQDLDKLSLTAKISRFIDS